MLSADLRASVDRAWDAVWSNGITNPITVSDLMGTVLMAGAPLHRDLWDRLFRAASDGDTPAVAQTLIAVRRVHGINAGSELESEAFWRDTRALQQAMVGMEFLHEQTLGTDVLGDIYEHILSKLSLAGQFGQFRTPRHVVDFMVELVAPGEGETVIDPACGSGGFLVSASDYRKRKGVGGRYVGCEIDRTVARIAEANLAFHAVEGGIITNGDGLASAGREADVILANPPFAGSVSDEIASRFQIRTKKTELLFLEAVSERLKPGGRAAVVVPSGVLTAALEAAREIRQTLVKGNRLRAVIELPSGVFRPYTDVKTAILVWDALPPSGDILMVRVENDGFSLDSRRIPVSENDLPLVGRLLAGQESGVAHCRVDLRDLIGNRYNLNPSRYLEHSRPEVAGDAPSAAEVLKSMSSRLVRIQERVSTLQKELMN